MQNGGAGLGGGDGLLGDLIGRDRQSLRHGGRVDRAGDGASDDDLVGFCSHCFSPGLLTDRSLFQGLVVRMGPKLEHLSSPSCAGLTRASISFAKRSSNEDGWIAGSSPAMTTLI
jgi:hypothetical protein